MGIHIKSASKSVSSQLKLDPKDIDLEAIQSIIAEKQSLIKSDVAELESLRTEYKNTYIKYKGTHLDSIPFQYQHVNNSKTKLKETFCNSDYFSFNDFEGWSDYKDDLDCKWTGDRHKVRIFGESAELILYIIAHIITSIIAFWIIIDGSYRNLHMWWLNWATIICGSYLAMELIVGFISTVNYIVIPNILDKRKLRRELKALNFKIKQLENNIAVQTGTLQVYKNYEELSKLTFKNIKRGTRDELFGYIESTRTDIIDTLKSEEIKEEYTRIIDKCEKLLDIASQYAGGITEVSKIYRIYINEINSYIESTGGSQTQDLDKLLANFEGFVDKKIEKFSKAHEFNSKMTVEALNKAFTETDEHE